MPDVHYVCDEPETDDADDMETGAIAVSKLSERISASSKTPIFVNGNKDQRNEVHKLLRANGLHLKCTFRIVNKNTIKIETKNGVDKKAIVQVLEAGGKDFHTFADKEEKRYTYLLKDLVESIKQKHIIAAIKMAKLPKADVQRHVTGYSKAKGVKLDVWRVTFAEKPDPRLLNKLKSINYCFCRIEHYHKKAVMQCSNCQHFHHSAAFCSNKSRCVQCVTSHDKGKCPRKLDKSLPLTCCNCLGNHSANDARNCPIFGAEIQRIADNKTSRVGHGVCNQARNDAGQRPTSFAGAVKVNPTPAERRAYGQPAEASKFEDQFASFIKLQQKQFADFMKSLTVQHPTAP